MDNINKSIIKMIFNDFNTNLINEIFTKYCHIILTASNSEVEKYYKIINPTPLLCGILYQYSPDKNFIDIITDNNIHSNKKIYNYCGINYDSSNIYIFNKFIDVFNHVEDSNYKIQDITKIINKNTKPFDYDKIIKEL